LRSKGPNLSGGLETGGKCAHLQTKILLLVTFIVVLSILPAYTLAAPYISGEGVTANQLQRTLDAYGKGPFCAGCHNLPYPLPPEKLTLQPMYPAGATEAEPGLKRLTDSPGRNVGAVYGPKGDKIVWETDSQGNWTIWIMNDDGNNKKQLTSESVISGWPSWSPDGREIAYWSYDPSSRTSDIWKMESDGSSKMKLTTEGTYKGPPMWSPRGDRIAYTANQTGNMEVYIINTDGSGERQITSGHPSTRYVETRVTWHPDGQRLYYQVTTFPLPLDAVTLIPDDVAFVEIYVVNVDTGEQANLTPRLHENVRSVSSDGKKMACISLRSPNYGLWIMNTDGTNQTRLTWDGKGDRAPRFGPDGKKIVYWSGGFEIAPKIWMINADGSNKTRLTTGHYQDIYPSWSPDGKKIIFESDRAGSFNIWQLSLDRKIDADVRFDGCLDRGGRGKASLTIKPTGNTSSLMMVEKVGMHFYWDDPGKYVENSSLAPANLSSQGNVFQIELFVPKNATLGYHFYDVKVQYSEVNDGIPGPSKVYEHSAGDLEVGIPEQTQCDRLYVELGGKLEQLHGQAINRSYALGVATSEVTLPLKGYFDYLQKKDAESFLKANDEFNEGRYLYLAGDYGTALTHFQTVKTLINQTSLETAEQGPSGLSVLVALLLVALIVAILTFHITRRRKVNQ
jgi:Tol biopolymer transport system component